MSVSLCKLPDKTNLLQRVLMLSDMSKQFSISGFDRTIFSLKDERGTFFIFLRSLAQILGPKKI